MTATSMDEGYHLSWQCGDLQWSIHGWSSQCDHCRVCFIDHSKDTNHPSFTHASTRAQRKAMVRNRRHFSDLTSSLHTFEYGMNDYFAACFARVIQRTAGDSDNKSDFWFASLFIGDCGHWTWHQSDLLFFLDLVSRLHRQWSLDICWYHFTDRFLSFQLHDDLSPVNIHSNPRCQSDRVDPINYQSQNGSSDSIQSFSDSYYSGHRHHCQEQHQVKTNIIRGSSLFKDLLCFNCFDSANHFSLENWFLVEFVGVLARCLRLLACNLQHPTP